MITVTVWVLIANLHAWNSTTGGGALVIDNIASRSECIAAIAQVKIVAERNRLDTYRCFPVRKVVR